MRIDYRGHINQMVKFRAYLLDGLGWLADKIDREQTDAQKDQRVLFRKGWNCWPIKKILIEETKIGRIIDDRCKHCQIITVNKIKLGPK